MKYNIDIEAVKRLYYDEKLSMAAVAQRLGVPKHHVSETMKHHGLKRRSRTEAQSLRVHKNFHPVSTTQIAQLYFDKQLTATEVAEKLGISPALVRHRLLKAGYTLRSHKEAMALPGNRKARGRAKIVFSEEEIQEICKLYCKEGLSPINIALRFNISVPVIHRILKAQGIRLRTAQVSQQLRRKKAREKHYHRIAENAGPKLSSSEVSEAKVIQLRTQENLLIDEIAIKCSLTNVEVYQILQTAGVI